jgi:hypothetical protein
MDRKKYAENWERIFGSSRGGDGDPAGDDDSSGSVDAPFQNSGRPGRTRYRMVGGKAVPEEDVRDGLPWIPIYGAGNILSSIVSDIEERPAFFGTMKKTSPPPILVNPAEVKCAFCGGPWPCKKCDQTITHCPPRCATCGKPGHHPMDHAGWHPDDEGHG